MRMLFMTTHIPDYPTDGIKIVSCNLLKRFHDVYHYDIDVVVFTLQQEPGDISRVLTYCRSMKIFQLPPYTLADKIVDLFHGTPAQVLKHYDPQAADAFSRYIAGKEYDLIYVMPLEVWPYAEKLAGIPRLLNTLDAHSLREIRQFHTEPLTKPAKYYSLLRHVKMARYEKNTYSTPDRCILVSEFDIAYLKGRGNQARFLFIPNGVDVDYIDPDKVAAAAGGPALAFSGDFSYGPNAQAAVFIYQRLYRDLKRDYPGLKLFLVGKYPTPLMRETITDKDAIITGYVEDVRPYLKAADLFVCPLHYGAGIKNKILEALAMRLPVVCSRVSVCGLEALHEEGLVTVAESRADFLRLIRKVLDSKKAYPPNARGRDYIMNHYSWDAVASRYAALIRELSPGKTAG